MKSRLDVVQGMIEHLLGFEAISTTRTVDRILEIARGCNPPLNTCTRLEAMRVFVEVKKGRWEPSSANAGENSLYILRHARHSDLREWSGDPEAMIDANGDIWINSQQPTNRELQSFKEWLTKKDARQ